MDKKPLIGILESSVKLLEACIPLIINNRETMIIGISQEEIDKLDKSVETLKEQIHNIEVKIETLKL